MQQMLPWAYGEDRHGALVPFLCRSHFGVMEQVVALLPRETHVDAEAVGRTRPSVAQDLLSLHHRLGSQESSTQEMAGWWTEKLLPAGKRIDLDVSTAIFCGHLVEH